MAANMFLQIQGIPGESGDEKHQGWIEILSYSFAASQPTTGSKSTAGARSAQRVDITDFSVVKQLDLASPKLFQHCCDGTHIPLVTLHLCRTINKEQVMYMEYKLEHVLVSSVRPSASNGADVPLEDVTFNPSKTSMDYTWCDHKNGNPLGHSVASWDEDIHGGG